MCKNIESVSLDKYDSAIVAVPPKDAFDVSCYLLRNHKRVFVEKPPASSSCEMEELISLSEVCGVSVQVGFNFRFSSAYRAFVESMKSLDLMHLSGHFFSRYPSGPEWGSLIPLKLGYAIMASILLIWS